MLKDIIAHSASSLSRRNLLLGAGAATGFSLSASACATPLGQTLGQSTGSARASQKGSGDKFSLKTPVDFSSPETNLLGLVRLLGDTSGKPVFGWSHGQVYGVLQGELSQLLFDYEAVQRREFKRLDDGSWVKGYRGLILFKDPQTGKVIDNFLNPFTNEENRVIHFKTSFGAAVYTPTGAYSLVAFKSEDQTEEGAPFIMPWTTVRDDVWATYDERVAYENTAGEWRVDNAVYRYHSSMEELTNPEITAPHANMMWSTELNWFSTMGMGDTPGNIMWAGMGRKYFSVDELPAYYMSEAENRYPGFITNPIDWTEYEITR